MGRMAKVTIHINADPDEVMSRIELLVLSNGDRVGRPEFGVGETLANYHVTNVQKFLKDYIDDGFDYKVTIKF